MKYSFTEDNINHYAPNRPGVYGLYDSLDTPIYYGKSDASIQERLKRHISGAEGQCTQYASTFNFEIVNNPIQRERELLEEFKRTYGKLPKCNDVI